MKSVLFTLLLGLVFVSVQAQEKADLEKLDKKLSELLEVSHSPGLSVAVVKGNEVIYLKGFGYSNLDKKQKVDENTLFAIGSTSKAFTTALLGIMEEEKGLSFKDSPRKYLSSLEFYNDELNSELTIEDLVCHRSGLPRHDFSWYLFPTEDKDSLLARVKHHEPFTDIRTNWYYNNFGYLIQGMITAKLTDKSWEQNIRDYFFTPMGMKRSNLSIAEMQEFKNIATGYEWRNLETSEPLPYFNIAAISPAGSINSSAKEMTNWLKVWLNEGKLGDKQILPAKYVAKAQNPLMLVGGGISDPKFPDQHLKSYGYAWFTSSYKGHYRMEHGGNIDGFTANVCLFPADDLGIVVLANQDGSLAPALARNIISDVLLSEKEDDWIAYHNEKVEAVRKQLEASKKEAKSNSVEGTKPSHILQGFAGVYHHPGYGKFSLVVKNDSLFAQFPLRKYYLKHTHYDIFAPYEVRNGKVDTLAGMGRNFNFRMNDMGDIESVDIKLDPTLDPINFSRTPAKAEVDNEKLKSYAGDYSLSGATLKVTDNSGSLLLDVPGQPQYTLLPVSETEFAIKGLSGYKAKFENGNLILLQPNGTFTAKKVK